MHRLFGWFRKQDDDYDKILDDISISIKKKQLDLSLISSRKRSWISNFLLLTIPLYLIFSIVFILNASDLRNQVYTIVFITVGLIVIIQFRKLITMWFDRLKRLELQELEKLQNQQQLKVEELKRKTSYYLTKGLIERYDSPTKNAVNAGSDAVDANSSDSAKENTPRKRNVKSESTTPKPKDKALNIQPSPLQMKQRQDTNASLRIQTQANQQGGDAHSLKYERAPTYTWVDRILDLIIGDSESNVQKYALICTNCFEHNGLAFANEYPTATFRCKKCGFLTDKSGKSDHGGSPLPRNAGAPLSSSSLPNDRGNDDQERALESSLSAKGEKEDESDKASNLSVKENSSKIVRKKPKENLSEI